MERVFVCNNRFNPEESLKQMIKVLDEGKLLVVGTDSLGHGDNNAWQESIKNKLEEHYEDKLVVVSREGYCSYGYTYRLK